MTALPCRAGIGFKHAHWPAIAADWPDIGFFEVHAENYMGAGGPPRGCWRRWPNAIRSRCTGWDCRSGARRGPNRDHLARLRALIDWLRPARFSEHLAWSTHEGDLFQRPPAAAL
ncbi:MAG: hypothetical protein KatS3mg118_2985 [Paracoccaceae bacterium]|nr:MAG: hypothetical protein KatS3mg118_2985 [Paracoccaceae bacterium]